MNLNEAPWSHIKASTTTSRITPVCSCAPEMTKGEVVAELEGMAWYRLFDCCPWLPDQESFWAANQKLIKMGLLEQISSDTWQNTPLGKELDVDLFEVFMGHFDVWEMPYILEKHCLLDEWESERICTRMSRKDDPESVLLGVVRQAYLDYGRATKFLH
jgi:hypothetical protein